MRDTTDGSQNFDIDFLHKYGYLECDQKYGSIQWSRNGEPTGNISISSHMGAYPYLNLNYTITSNYTGEKRSVDYDVRLLSTPCNFGGKRWWFMCWNCTRIANKIYRSISDKFLCRKCNNLAYPSQNVNRRSVWHQVGKVLDSDQQEKLPQYWDKYRFYRRRPTKNYLKLLYSMREIDKAEQYLHASGWFNNYTNNNNY